ncbi:MAG: response regulator [Pseudomonadota bacterium]
MIVDDEAGFVETLAQRLELREFQVSTALSGDEALNSLTQAQPDVVVLDVQMPGRDGVETLRLIKAAHPLVEVIMLTGHATVESAIEGMKLGAFDYLLKPTETGDLVDKITRAHARKKEQEDRIQKAEINKIVHSRGW